MVCAFYFWAHLHIIHQLHMFNKVRVSTLLLGSFVLANALTGCGDKAKEDPTPKEYKLMARYTAKNTSANDEDSGIKVDVLFTDESGDNLKGALINSTSQSEDTGESYEIPMVASDKVSVELEFPGVDTAAEAKALPATTAIKLELLVEGKVKKTITLDKNTAFDVKTGTLHLEQNFKVSEL